MREIFGVRAWVFRSDNRKSKIQNLKWLVLATLSLTTVSLAEAQRQGKVPRIGYLSAASSTSQSSRVEAFWQGLRELGYVEGKNIVLEYRYAEGNQIA